MVTMKQIDEARGLLERARKEYSQYLEALCTRTEGEDRYALKLVANAEAEVNRLLCAWWVQGCQEAAHCPGCRERDDWRDIAKTNKAYLEGAIIRAKKAEARAEEACDAMQSVVDRCRLRCKEEGRRPEDGGDWVDEVLAAHDDARIQLGSLRGQRNDWQAKYDALNRHREDQEKLIEALKKDREVAEREIARLKHYERELDETNKKIYVDRDRLAVAIRDAFKRLRSGGGLARAEAELFLDNALKDHDALPTPSAPPAQPSNDINTPPTKSWVMEQIAEELYKHRVAEHRK